MSIIGKWNVAFKNTCIILIGAAKALSCNKRQLLCPQPEPLEDGLDPQPVETLALCDC
jgi:hypothetical protein